MFFKPDPYAIILELEGFGRACAPVRCAHPSFGRIATQTEALRAPRPSQLRCFKFIGQKYKFTISRN
jgi:hypothetical protein